MTEIDIIQKDGYYVDVKTGECYDELIFSHNTFRLTDKQRIPDKRWLNLYSTKDISWHRLKKTERMTNNTFYTLILTRFNFITNLLNENLSYELIIKMRKFVSLKEPHTYLELYKLMFEYMYDFDIPITTKELTDAIIQTAQTSSFRKTLKRFFKKISNSNKIRTYYWYIVKRLERLPLDDETKTKFEKIIWFYYNIIRFRLPTSYNPLTLIDYLVFHVVKQYGEHIPDKFTLVGYHECGNFKNQNAKKIFSQITLSRLDVKFKYKLKLII